MSRLRGVAVAALLAGVAPGDLQAQRQIYKCIENGRVIYSERKVCSEPPLRDESLSATTEDLPPDGVNVASEIQAEFEKEKAAKRQAQEAERAKAAADEAAGALAADECKAEMRRPAEVVNSAWDGSVFQVEQYLKRRYLRDPDSYESVGWTKVERHCKGYRVMGTYRARNGFGGMNVESAIFELDRAGNVINMIK